MGFKKMGLISEFLGFFFQTGMLLCMAQGNFNYYDFILKETNFTRLCSTKSILTVNGSFPGPVLRVHKGDTIYVNVHNHGQYGVSLHWHGVKQPRNPWSDGPEYITQCAIQPGSNFTYEVIFSKEEGTLWWHAHSDWTRATVHGALVILPAVGTTYPFPTPDEEETIVLASWFKEDVMTMMVHALATGSDFSWSDAFTINGQPGDLCPCSKASWFKKDVMAMIMQTLVTRSDFAKSNAFTINGQLGDLCPCSKGYWIYIGYMLHGYNSEQSDDNQSVNAATFTIHLDSTHRFLVDYGKTYLFRIVNAVMNNELFFSIAQHNLTVVGWDGAYVKPFLTSYIEITPGQTMDVLVTANQSPSQYYMAAAVYYTPDLVEFDTTIPTAILQYRGNYTPPQSPYPPTLPAYNDSKAATDFTSRTRSLASPDHPINVPKNITTQMFITVSLNRFHSANSSSYRLATSLNNISFVDPSIDILLAYYRNLSGVYDADFPDKPPYLFNFTGANLSSDNFAIPSSGTKVKVLNYNEAVEIVFQGTNVLDGSADHPMHLHGHSFYVVGTGYGDFNNETDPNSYNLNDPPEANTIGVPKDGWTTIRFVANNPGVWYMHCHVDRHLSWGMTTAFIVKNGGTTATSIRPPPTYLPPCRVSAIDPLRPVNIDHLSNVIT